MRKILLVSLLLIPGSMVGMLHRTARLRTALKRITPKMRCLKRSGMIDMNKRLLWSKKKDSNQKQKLPKFFKYGIGLGGASALIGWKLTFMGSPSALGVIPGFPLFYCGTMSAVISGGILAVANTFYLLNRLRKHGNKQRKQRKS